MDCADDDDGGSSMVSSEEGHADDRGGGARSKRVFGRNDSTAMSFERLFDRHQKLGRRTCTTAT